MPQRARGPYTLGQGRRLLARRPAGRLLAKRPAGRLLAGQPAVWVWEAATGSCRSVLEGHADFVNAVAFSPDGQYIQTSRGDTPLHSPSNSSPSSQREQLSHIFIQDQWITLDQQRLLWLPPEYRPTCSIVKEDLACLGHSSGRITLLQLCSITLSMLSNRQGTTIVWAESCGVKVLRSQCDHFLQETRNLRYHTVVRETRTLHTVSGLPEMNDGFGYDLKPGGLGYYVKSLIAAIAFHNLRIEQSPRLYWQDCVKIEPSRASSNTTIQPLSTLRAWHGVYRLLGLRTSASDPKVYSRYPPILHYLSAVLIHSFRKNETLLPPVTP
ncbi:uncharacterized protein BDR25DRAFT_396427 [Lindgomyces ingoldianus]|uniref:Uncharacterized protein n=1 Tax=Lindgomyces ingoldianus TaxID=673940 RepID=A0ACB6QDG0_9PLEO|nr:uncharacterized protein BDR25DRAFT_396427 [Lindgomyces ingoldianus]KAF2465019.1 hypothetical protein BDR25DRAFT_396427 [Lindgomyces ingoldianus]